VLVVEQLLGLSNVVSVEFQQNLEGPKQTIQHGSPLELAESALSGGQEIPFKRRLDPSKLREGVPGIDLQGVGRDVIVGVHRPVEVCEEHGPPRSVTEAPGGGHNRPHGIVQAACRSEFIVGVGVNERVSGRSETGRKGSVHWTSGSNRPSLVRTDFMMELARPKGHG
jgi:hypothetical protein